MNQDQFLQIVDNALGDYGKHIGEKYNFHHKMIAEQDQEQYNQVFLYNAVLRNALEDALDIVGSWALRFDRTQKISDYFTAEDNERLIFEASREMASSASEKCFWYLQMGYKAEYNNTAATDNSATYRVWDDLLAAPEGMEQYLPTRYDIVTAMEHALPHGCVLMEQAVVERLGYNESTWDSLFGGCAYTVLSMCVHNWSVGNQVAKAVKTAEEMEGALLGDLDFDISELEGLDGGDDAGSTS